MAPTINPKAASLLLECFRVCSLLCDREDVQNLGGMFPGDTQGPSVYAHLRSLSERLESFIVEENDRIAQGGAFPGASDPIAELQQTMLAQLQNTVEEFSFTDRAILAALTGLCAGLDSHQELSPTTRAGIAGDAVQIGEATYLAREAAKAPKG